ncbi:MAG: M48 family metalloprotease [Candidatus Tectomicrobia bacterium]|uniref:M48 family metalloprotease n=1 Tax=Tectimicrobiota bacterium TaxID=2528274 RepID=A0A932MN38_UNCTE|nr:M48 family metalloprotease [Candidatus Tectomicrobia bacterium]
MHGKIAALLLALILSGCGAVSRNTMPNPGAHPQFRRFAGILIEYQKIACPDCKPNDWKIGIVRSGAVNAYSTGGGNFYVTEGALTRIPDEELDALAAHEVAHEIAGHNAKLQMASVAVTGVFVALGALVPGATLGLIAQPLVHRAYSREQEFEADAIAAALMEKRHGNSARTRYINVFLRRHAAELKARGQEGDGGLFDTHPLPEERQARIDQIIRGVRKGAAIPPYSRADILPAGQEAAAQQE